MRKIFWALWMGTWLAAAVTGWGEEPSDSAKQEIQAMLNQMQEAFDRRDLSGVIRLGLPESKMTLLNGRTLGVSEWMTKADAWLRSARNMSSSFKLLSVEVTGDQAECVLSKKHSFDIPEENGQWHEYKVTSRWNTLLVKTAEGWKVSRMKEIDNRALRDGLPIPASQVPKAGELLD